MVTLSRGSRATYGLYRIWASCPVTLHDFLVALLRSYFRVIRRPPKLQLGSLQVVDKYKYKLKNHNLANKSPKMHTKSNSKQY